MKQKQQKQELRLKIKKLKYKIEKEDQINKKYIVLQRRLQTFGKEQLTIQNTIKKINFLLQLKGMTLIDWVRSLPYQEPILIEDLLNFLDLFGVKLLRSQRNIIQNFMTKDLTGKITQQDVNNLAYQFGISNQIINQ